MLTDVEIAQQAKIQNITAIAEKLNLSADDLEFYGKYKAKISKDVWARVIDGCGAYSYHDGLAGLSASYSLAFLPYPVP